MPLSYNPRHGTGWIPKPGTYDFSISSCSETVFKTGAPGVSLLLDVDAGAPLPLKCRDHIVFGERSTWKMQDLCNATGVRFDPPCEAEDLVGKAGKAKFTTREWEGFVNLKVLQYVKP